MPNLEVVDLHILLTLHLPLRKIAEAYESFGELRDGVVKVAIKP
jgi:threonine dehydrogenase-like Zn-dependent dehydrogenase